MRLGQLARKYEIPLQDILSFLEEETGEKFHANAKLFDAIEEKVYSHFDLYPENPVIETEILEDEEDSDEDINEEPITDDVEVNQTPKTPEEDIASVDGELETSEHPENVEKLEPEVKPDVPEKPRPKEDEVIQTDKLLELLESEELHSDLEKIKLIKAPKKELSGLKVLGKVDLPEPKKKKDSEKPYDPNEESSRRGHNKRPRISEEEREKRRLKAKRKKEAYEARQVKKRKEQEAQRLRELKEKHYKEKLQKTEVSKKSKRPPKKKEVVNDFVSPKKSSKPEPKTLLGKWWRWMNT